MAALVFHPHFRDTLDGILDAVGAEGALLTVPRGVDQIVMADQITRFCELTGRRAVAQSDGRGVRLILRAAG